MYNHLGWLLHQGENRKTVMTCRFCQENPVTQFSVIFSAENIPSLGQGYTCCDGEHCKTQLFELSCRKDLYFYPFAFDSMTAFHTALDVEKVDHLFRWAFGLTGKLTAEKAFAFFQKEP